MALNSIDQGFVVYDLENRLIICNDRYRDFFSIPNGMLEPGTALIDFLRRRAGAGLYGEGDPEALAQARLQEIIDHRDRTEEQLTTSTGCILYVRRYTVAGFGYVSTFTDISELKRVENQLASRTTELDAKVRELDFQKDALDEHAIVSITDAQGNITYANDRFCSVSGYSREELLGQNHRILNSEPHRAEFFADLWRTVVAGKVWHGNIRNRKKDGEYYWIDATIVPFADERGVPFQYIGISTDVTERVRAEEAVRLSEERFKAYTATASDWVWEMDGDFRFSYVSDRAFKTMMIRREDIIGHLRWDFAGPEVVAQNPELWAAHCEDLENHRPFRDFRYPLTRPDGTVMHISLNGDPIFGDDGAFMGYRGTSSDITALVTAQGTLEQAQVEAEKANRAKSEFLSSMSHELRTPLNAILGFAQLLEFGKKDPLTDRQKDQVRQIMKGGNHLLELIDEVLDLAKIEAGKLSLSIETVDMRNLVDECLSFAGTLAAKRDITIEDRTGDALPMIWADRLRSKQALLNLLSNAVKYNREGGQIWLDAEQRNDGAIWIGVTDTGLGIPEDKHADLFRPFSRLGAGDQEIEGTGIGLVITKKLVEEMDATMGFDSTPGEGSTFWVEFPLAVEDLKEAPLEEQDDAVADLAIGSEERLLLYVEDNPTNLALMEDIIEDVSNLTMISTHTAELGLALAEERKPDVIILDINLPGMNGIEAVQILKKLDATKDIPVLALSANAMPDTIERGRQAGFRDYLKKPVNVSELMAALQDALSVQR